MLSIERSIPDVNNKGQMKDLPTSYFDIGKFCSAVGVSFDDFCWEFLCSYFLSTFDRPKKVFCADDGKLRNAMRVACGRCPHSADTVNHLEALGHKHKLPKDFVKLVT